MKSAQMIVKLAIACIVFEQSLVFAQPQRIETRIGTLEHELGLPTKATSQKLFDEMDFQRATQAYLWSLPLVGMAQSWEQHHANTGASDGDIVIYEGYRDVSVWLTANASTPYIIGMANLKRSGQLIIEIPAGKLAGLADDAWQRPIGEFGLTGEDKGKGGTYLILGPGQKAGNAKVDFTLKSSTNLIIFFYRVLENDEKKAEALKKSVRVYPLSKTKNPPPTRFLKPKSEGKLVLQTQPRGMEYWKLLAKTLNDEPVHDRDRFFMAMLRPLGIVKGKPFEPNERQTKILTEAALVGESMAKANSFDKRIEGARYRPDCNWDFVITVNPFQDLKGWSQLDERAAYTYEATTTAPGMVSKTPGVGSGYLGAYRDSEGGSLDGGKHYSLRVPPKPPVGQFWSVTLYDLETRALLQNKQQRADISSKTKPIENEDGSVDLYFGPTAPKGKERNWIPTVPGKAWFAYFRFYAPLEPFFKKEWPLPSIQPVN